MQDLLIYVSSHRKRSCTWNERIIAEPETQVVYPFSIVMEGGRHGTRPVFPRAPATRTALPLHAPVLGVATGSSRDGPDDAHTRHADQAVFQSLEALSWAYPQAFL